MHELSIAQNIVDLVLENLPDNINKISIVNIKVGEISGVIPESLEFCFNVIIKNTKLDGAKLNIEKVPATAYCKACDKDFQIEHLLFTCPYCFGTDIKLITGNELEIINVVVDE
ncbi:MAG: hydrogenase maturation nickel metallochaperone HypA [Ignavibacteria bacterium]|nr:hydrogenase maturation nickel metallochaperone HypA [Ignavibacteria bacterium]